MILLHYKQTNSKLSAYQERPCSAIPRAQMICEYFKDAPLLVSRSSKLENEFSNGTSDKKLCLSYLRWIEYDSIFFLCSFCQRCLP